MQANLACRLRGQAKSRYFLLDRALPIYLFATSPFSPQSCYWKFSPGSSHSEKKTTKPIHDEVNLDMLQQTRIVA